MRVSQELSRMQQGRLHPQADDVDGEPFRGGAPTSSLSPPTSLTTRTGSAIFPPYAVRDFQGIRVAFIGLTLEGTPH